MKRFVFFLVVISNFGWDLQTVLRQNFSCFSQAEELMRKIEKEEVGVREYCLLFEMEFP